jgi:hypothetical protein
VGGRIDYHAEDHEQTMLALGLQSKREITRTRIRVRTAMAAKTREQGRYLGGRPPYGYLLADAGPHSAPGPNRPSGMPARDAVPAPSTARAGAFLVHPNPSLGLAAHGASLCGMLPALKELAFMLGFRDSGAETFTGPARGSGVEPDLLHRACWGLALLTEVFRRGPDVAAIGPLGRLSDRSARSLLDAAPDAGLDQLAALRGVMESVLLAAIASRRGLWAVGPLFAGSEIMPGDADLIAGGLLTELKTIKKPSLGVTDLWQVLGYAVMDYVDEFGITDVAVFSGRYGYLAQWNLDVLLSGLAGRPLTAAELRAEFRALLEACRRR